VRAADRCGVLPLDKSPCRGTSQSTRVAARAAASWYEAPIDALSSATTASSCGCCRRRRRGRRGSRSSQGARHPCGSKNSARTTSSRATKARRLPRGACSPSPQHQPEERTARGLGDVPIRSSTSAPAWSGLRRGGIDVRGRLRPVGQLPGPVWEKVAVFKSDLGPLSRCATSTVRTFYAESMLKLPGSGAAARGSWREGVRASPSSSRSRRPAGLLPNMTDGSGLSREKPLHPAAGEPQLLRAMFLTRGGRSSCSRCLWPATARVAAPPHAPAPLPRQRLRENRHHRRRLGALRLRQGGLPERTYAFSLLLNRTRSVAAARAEQNRIVMALRRHG